MSPPVCRTRQGCHEGDRNPVYEDDNDRDRRDKRSVYRPRAGVLTRAPFGRPPCHCPKCVLTTWIQADELNLPRPHFAAATTRRPVPVAKVSSSCLQAARMLLVTPALGLWAEEGVRDEGVHQLPPPRWSNPPAAIPEPRHSHCGCCVNRCCWNYDVGGGGAGNRAWRHNRDERPVVGEILAHCDRVVDTGSDGTPSGGTPSGGTPSGGTPHGGTPRGGTAASCASGAEATAGPLVGGGLCVDYQ